MGIYAGQKERRVVRLLSRDKDLGVQSFMLHLLNNHCPQLRGLMEGPRLESRVNLCLVVVVIPVQKKQLLLDQQFTAVTKEFTCRGVSLVLNDCRASDELIIGFRSERTIKFARGQARHLSSMGGGFWQLGLRLTEIVGPERYPELADIRL
jgi:hypothetical protein